MNNVYIVSTGRIIIGKTGNGFRKYEVEDILRVFSDEEDAFRCFQAACGVGMDRNWPIGKKFYIYNDTYVVMRVYGVKGE